jgi:hypothetical protein
LIYYPPLATALDHIALPPAWWAWLVPYGLILYSLDWFRKSLLRSLNKVKLVNRKAAV